MTGKNTTRREPFAGHSVTAIAGTLLVLCGAFAVTRALSSAVAFYIAQIIYLIPAFVAALMTMEAFFVGPAGDERRVWGLLSVGAWMLVVSETYYSWYQVVADRASPPAPYYDDWLNLAAAAAFLAVLFVASGFERYSSVVRLRFIADAVAIMSLGLMVLFRFWSSEIVGSRSWFAAVRWSLHSFVGVAMLCTIVWLAFGARNDKLVRPRNILVAISITVFAFGIMLAPMPPETATIGADGALTIVLGVLFMGGYSLMALAGILRVRERTDRWQLVMSRPPGEESELTNGVMSLLVLLTVCLGGLWAYGAQSAEVGSVYFVLGTLATFSMVGRTAVISLESGALRESVSKDPITGLGNQSAFGEDLESMARVARRTGEPFVLATLDLDDFTRVNEANGRLGGDRALSLVGAALVGAAGSGAKTYRPHRDHSAVMVPRAGIADRERVGADLLAAVSGVVLGDGMRMTASVGVVSCDSDSCTAGSLVRDAEASQVSAKYHGKARVVVHDERIVRALGAEERLRLDDARLHYEVARALAACADARDPRNVYHSRNVSALSVLLGEAVGVDEEELRVLEIAAMLHDVGQIALPDDILSGPFTPSRRLAAREHATLGARLVESVGAEGVSAAVRGHHERWDGTGYPDGLTGEEIPLTARIITLADSYDGMTSGRRSGSSMSRAAALQEIDHGLGTRFDPLLAEEFIRLVGTTSSLGWSNEWVVR